MADAQSIRRVVTSACLALALSACAGPPETFDLVARNETRDTAPSRARFFVAEPTTSQALKSERLVVRRKDGAIAYLTGAQWSDRLPRLIQTAMVAKISGAYRDDADVPTRGHATRYLSSEIERFEADVTHKNAMVVLVVHVSDVYGHIRATRSFTAEAPFAKDSPALIADAMNIASTHVLADVDAWVTRQR